MFSRNAAVLSITLAFSSAVYAQSGPSGDNSSAVPSPAEDASQSMRQPAPGDRWTYEVRDEITGVVKATSTNTVTDISPTEVSVRIENLGNQGYGFYVFDRSWNVKTTPTWKYSPNDGSGIKLPLKEGNSWKIEATSTFTARAGNFRRSGRSKVVARESVTTRAGTFDSYKIETSIITRNVADPTKKSDLAMTSWYAPSVDHWVKRQIKTSAGGHVTESISSELVEFGRR